MSRIPIPVTLDAAPIASQPLLEAVKRQLGSVPKLVRLLALSPASLEGMLGLNGALAKGELEAKTRERIALAIANINDCAYCLSAHTYLGGNVAKLDDSERAANRDGRSSDARANAALQFASRVVHQHGKVSREELTAVRAAGYGDGKVREIVLHVALNTLTNYVNGTFETDVDFPVVR